MSYKILPCFKSHYSRGKSLFTLEDAKDKKGSPIENSLFHVLKSHNLDTLVLIDDDISGLLQASQNAKKNNIRLVFGLRLWVTSDAKIKDEDQLSNQAKYLIVAKDPSAYTSLLKLWSYAANDGFYYEPRLDFKTIEKYWGNNLALWVPFYDSFLHLNSLNTYKHIPQFHFTKPLMLIEDNNLPFDQYISQKVKSYAKTEKLDTLHAQSIFYYNSDDFIAYLTNRCLHNRTTLEKPELEHMSSDEFNFEKWRTLNGR